MAFYVRKLSKRKSIEQIAQADSFEDMLADAATAEFRTTSGALSTWEIESMEKLDEAVLAIAATSTKIERMDFIVIDREYIERNDLICENTYAGKEIAIPDLQDTHYDIKGVTIAKLINCVRMYREIYELDNDSGQYIIRYAEREILKLLKNAQNAGRMIIDLLPKDVRNVLSA